MEIFAHRLKDGAMEIRLQVDVLGGVVRKFQTDLELFQRDDSANTYGAWHSVTPSAQSNGAMG
jgi:hypothetical protein